MTTTPVWGVGLLSGLYSTAFTPCARPVMYSGWLWANAWGLQSAAATPRLKAMHLALMPIPPSLDFAPDALPDAIGATRRCGRADQKGGRSRPLRSDRRDRSGRADRRSRGVDGDGQLPTETH